MFIIVPDVPTSTPCADTDFRCGDSQKCIHESKVCDAHKDCDNGDDEPLSCGKSSYTSV